MTRMLAAIAIGVTLGTIVGAGIVAYQYARAGS